MTQRGAGGSVVFDRAAGYYDDTRGLPDEVSEQIADRMEAAAGPDARFLEPPGARSWRRRAGCSPRAGCC